MIRIRVCMIILATTLSYWQRTIQDTRTLLKLVSNAWVDGYYYRPRTDREQLEKYHEGLIVCTACIAGEVPNKIIHDDIEGGKRSLRMVSSCLWR